MAILASEGFQGGTLGNAVQEAETIFSSIDNDGITYVTGLDGSSLACNVNPSGSVTGALRTSGFAAMGDVVLRFIFKVPTALPTSNITIAEFNLGDPSAGGSRIAQLQIVPAGNLRLRNQFTQVAISTTVLALNTEYAVEWRFDGATKQQTLRIFTNVSETAVASETLGPVAADTVGATTVDWIQIGKLTGAVWTGGITFDKYRRADGWISAPANVLIWDQEWVGTDGNDIAVPSGWVKEGSNTASPKYSTGGPHVDQSVLYYNGQSVGNRNLLSPQLPAGTVTYERFYIQNTSKPETETQEEEIWSAGSLAGVKLFRLVMVSGTNNNYSLELWADDDWNPTLVPPVDGEPLPEPLGTIADLSITSYHRIEIEISATTGPATCTVKVWRGAAKNSTGTPNDVVSGDCVGTTSLRYRRFGQMLHPLVSNTATHRNIAFDSIAAAQDGTPIGPISEANQFDPPLNQQWAFFEWTGTEEVPLGLAGASLGGATLEEVNIGDTTNPPKPSDKLFTADPGLGKKLYASADSNGTPRYDVIADLYNFEMRTLSAGSGHPASDRCAPGCYRSFYGKRWGATDDKGNVIPMPTFSAHTSNNWDEERRAAANTAISSWSIDCISASFAKGIYDGNYDSWITGTLAPYITDVYERYGHLFIFDLGNEPDSGATPAQHSPLYLARIKRAVRYIHFLLLSVDVPEEAFMISMATTFSQMSANHEKAHQVAINTTDSSWPGGVRGDALYYWIADWKSTRTTTGGYWSDAYDPNPADFIQPGEMDQWNYGRGPTTRMWSCNFYDRQYEHLNTLTTLAKFRANVPSIAGSGYGRTGNTFKFLKALYGGANPVLPVSSAGPNGIPVFIGELGMGVWNPLPYTDNPAEPGPTADAYCEVFMKDLVEKCNVVAYAKWRYEPNLYTSAGNSPGGSFTHHYKTDGQSRGGNLWDPTNSNTKAEAAIFNTTYVADPPSWPNGRVRPPYVSLNGGAKRDYRGRGDLDLT